MLGHWRYFGLPPFCHVRSFGEGHTVNGHTHNHRSQNSVTCVCRQPLPQSKWKSSLGGISCPSRNIRPQQTLVIAPIVYSAVKATGTGCVHPRPRPFLRGPEPIRRRPPGKGQHLRDPGRSSLPKSGPGQDCHFKLTPRPGSMETGAR